MPLPSWSQVSLLGYYSILRNSDQLKDSYARFAETKAKIACICR